MDELEARTFEHGQATGSILALTLAAEARGCACEPYRDWFTYNRWQAQGMQVQKGEHGVPLVSFHTVEKVDAKTGKAKSRSIPRTTRVFCRCQVQPIAASEPAAA